MPAVVRWHAGDILHNERMEYLRPYLHESGFVPSVLLLFVLCALMRAMRDSMWRIAILSLPGTIAHELTHFVVGALLLAKPHDFSCMYCRIRAPANRRHPATSSSRWAKRGKGGSVMRQ